MHTRIASLISCSERLAREGWQWGGMKHIFAWTPCTRCYKFSSIQRMLDIDIKLYARLIFKKKIKVLKSSMKRLSKRAMSIVNLYAI